MEQLLLAANGQQYSALEVAARCGLPVDEARRHLNNICTNGDAHNTAPGHRGAALYLAGPRPVVAVAIPPTVSRIPAHLYDGRDLQPFTGRPGAMDAFRLPSLQAGELVPRRTPMLIGRQPDHKR